MSGHSAQELARTHAGRIYGVVVVKAARRKSLRALGRLYVKARAFGPPDRGSLQASKGFEPFAERRACYARGALEREGGKKWLGWRPYGTSVERQLNRGNNSGRGMIFSYCPQVKAHACMHLRLHLRRVVDED